MTSASRRAQIPANEPDDATVLSRIAEGDLALLGTLYDRYGAQLRRICRRVGGEHEAADIVHTAFLRVIALAGSYDARGVSARPWLVAIVLKVAQEHRRSVRRWGAAMLGFALQPRRHVATIQEARTDLDQCLMKLSPPKRTVLVLAEVEGFTCEEIASMLSIPIGTVWTRLHHARRELRLSYRGADE
jgi:RNA polymerase sigma-70 factor (ECF subfamily)